MNRTELREKLNNIDCENCNQYDLLNLYESVMIGEEDEKTLSEMLESNAEAEKIHDFLCGTLNEGGWYGEPREKSYYYQADYHLPDYFYSQTVYDIPSSEIGDDVELSIKKYIADQEGYGEDEEYIDGIEVWNIREYDDDGDFVDESLSESEDIQSRIDELEERIQKLVKRYQSAQKQYHGDSSLSKRIEAEISGLEDEQRKLKSRLYTEESLSEAQERQAKIEVRKVYSWYDVYVDNVLLLKHLSEEDAKEIMKTMDDNNYPYIYREAESAKEYDLMSKEQGYVTEDTIKQGSKWVNKGKEGTHGKFKTKKEADAQRKAMFAKGFSVNESVDPNTLPDDYVLLNLGIISYTDEDIDFYYECIKELVYPEEIEYKDLEVTFITNQRDADDWDEETYKIDWTYRPKEDDALDVIAEYLGEKFPGKITVGDIKKSATDIKKYLYDHYYEDAVEDAKSKNSLADFREQLKEDKAKDTMKSVVAKWRSRRSNKSAD